MTGSALPGVNIGIPLSATDPDGDTLTYSLSGTNAAAFAIDSSSGQLKTKAPLDYETKNQYVVRVTVFDGNGNADAITVTIHVRDVSELSTNDVSELSTNDWPTFTEGDNTTRPVAENTPSGQNVGSALGIAMPSNPVRYDLFLSGPDAQSFKVGFSENGGGQLKTRAPLDFETKNQYTVKIQIFVAQQIKDAITVTIHVTDVDESASDGNGGSDTITVIMAREMIGLQDGPQLQQNVPNPFNSETVITWFLLRPGAAHVEVFALTGQRVAVLHQGPKKAGIHRVHWDGRDDRGRPLASGVYLYRLVTNEDIQTRKLTLLR